jgi:aryl-alcohol dehydrogenase-like predicted oxidoreductase
MYREQAEDVRLVTRELGLRFDAYAPLGRGLLTGSVQPSSLRDGDERLRHPRFQPENLDRNLALVRNLESVAAKYRCSAGQVALAWLLAQGDDIIPIPGTKTRSRMIENTNAAHINLAQEDLDFLAEAFPHGVAAGTRYRSEHMKNMYL